MPKHRARARHRVSFVACRPHRARSVARRLCHARARHARRGPRRVSFAAPPSASCTSAPCAAAQDPWPAGTYTRTPAAPQPAARLHELCLSRRCEVQPSACGCRMREGRGAELQRMEGKGKACSMPAPDLLGGACCRPRRS
uniref:Uncharacterized protein n=1 Tax=Arundo donax TaxID=35708 RepID=A0A0A9FE86_ARUDO